MAINPRGGSLVLSLAVLGAGCVSLPSKPGGPLGGMPVIDVHTHADFDNKLDPDSKIPNTREEFLRERARAGIVASISHCQDETCEGPDPTADKVFRCGGVRATPDLTALEAGLRGKRFRCIKVYLGYEKAYAYDAVYDPVYRLAAQYKVPVVFHTGDTLSDNALVKYADPLTIDEVAVAHRDVTFVIAHLGNPWIESAAEVAYKNPNVAVEASGMLVGDIKSTVSEDVKEYMIRPVRWAFGYISNPSKFMFGTDWPLVDMADYLEVYRKAIPQEHWRAVFHDNAVRVFGLQDAGL
ncbi:MAG: amidohydrolase family protein [Elusimicrobiota bacterium]